MKPRKTKVFLCFLVVLLFMGTLTNAMAEENRLELSRKFLNSLRKSGLTGSFSKDNAFILRNPSTQENTLFWQEGDRSIVGVTIPTSFSSTSGSTTDDTGELKKEENIGSPLEMLFLQTEGGIGTGVFPGNVTISADVTSFTLDNADIRGDLHLSVNTELKILGQCSFASVNGQPQSDNPDPNSVMSVKMARFCIGCSKEIPDGQYHVTYPLPCKKHYMCMDRESETEDLPAISQIYGQHQIGYCGVHYRCDEHMDPSFHDTKTGICNRFICHNTGASHNRCKFCGAPLCNGKRHGDTVCANFVLNHVGKPVETTEPIP